MITVIQLFLVSALAVAQKSTVKAPPVTPPPAAPAPKPWTHQSQLSFLLTSGNANTENLNFKQDTSLNLAPDLFRVTAQYIRVKDSGEESARRWNLGLRYERTFIGRLGAFLGQLIESDIFGGFVQRNSTDIGGKYHFIQSDMDQWFLEAGYRNTHEYRVVSSESATTHYGRTYTEWNHVWEPKISHRLWVEYLPNFSVHESYFLNAEPSVIFQLNGALSLQIAYTMIYRNLPPDGKVKLDTLYSTILSAKF